MLRHIWMLFAGLATFIAAPSLRAEPVALPIMQMESDGYKVDMPWYLGEDEFYHIGYKDEQTGEARPYVYETDEFRVQMSGLLDPDPVITYGFSVVDFGAPSSFSFTFTLPIVPTGPLTVVSASLSGGLTDGEPPGGPGGSPGVTLTPTLPDLDGDSILELAVNEVLSPTTNMGVDLGTALSGTGAFSFNEATQPGPTGLWTTLQTTIAFGLSGGNDTVAFVGSATVETIPEPSTVALLAIGGSMLLGRRLLRRRAVS